MTNGTYPPPPPNTNQPPAPSSPDFNPPPAGAQPPPGVPLPSNASPPPMPDKPKKRLSWIVGIALGVGLLLTALCLCGIFLFSGEEEASLDDTQRLLQERIEANSAIIEADIAANETQSQAQGEPAWLTNDATRKYSFPHQGISFEADTAWDVVESPDRTMIWIYPLGQDRALESMIQIASVEMDLTDNEMTEEEFRAFLDGFGEDPENEDFTIHYIEPVRLDGRQGMRGYISLTLYGSQMQGINEAALDDGRLLNFVWIGSPQYYQLMMETGETFRWTVAFPEPVAD